MKFKLFNFIKEKYDTIINIMLNSALYLLVTFAIALVLVSTLWLCKISLPYLTLPISFTLSILLISLIRKNNKFINITSIILSIFILIISILISGYFYDMSYDGNSYHKEAILNIDRGWNPIYEKYEEFASKNNLPSGHPLWATTYPKATWMLADSIYKLTNNIETGKAINLIMIFITFSIFSYLFYKLLNKKLFNLILGFLIAVNPIVVSQIISFYLDGFMGLLFFLTIGSMIMYVLDDKDKDNKIIIASSLIILINCKFTGFAYAGLFCLGFYIYYLYHKIKKKEFKDIRNSIIFFTLTVLISVVLVGSNTYIKNIIDYHNPFYPLIGKNKVDIMTSLQPYSFKDMTPIKKNFYSIFSKSANIGVFNNKEPELKIPFTFDIYEISQVTIDTRIGGYGVLFSGIFLISIIVLIISFIYNRRNKYNIFIIIPLIINILLMFFLSDGWWARYSPWLYLFIIFALIALASSKKKFMPIIFTILSILVFCNTSLNFARILVVDIPRSSYTSKKLKELKNSDIYIHLEIENLSGIKANLLDNNINYEVKYIEGMEPLYGEYLYYKNK